MQQALKMSADEPKINPVAAMENWKAAVVKEQAVASNFHENWGYLKAKPEECKVRAVPRQGGSLTQREGSAVPSSAATAAFFTKGSLGSRAKGTILGLVPNPPFPTWQPRAFETRLVKYFNKGVATVREKRLALEGEARGDTPPTPEHVNIPSPPRLSISPTPLSPCPGWGGTPAIFQPRASDACAHQAKVPEDPDRAKKMVAAATYMTVNGDYGSRGSLELFGVAQHGIRSDITKHGI